jgi:hypothetical protein
LSYVGKTCEKLLVLQRNIIFSQQKILPSSGRIILKRVGNTGERREAVGRQLTPTPLPPLNSCFGWQQRESQRFRAGVSTIHFIRRQKVLFNAAGHMVISPCPTGEHYNPPPNQELQEHGESGHENIGWMGAWQSGGGGGAPPILIEVTHLCPNL